MITRPIIAGVLLRMLCGPALCLFAQDTILDFDPERVLSVEGRLIKYDPPVQLSLPAGESQLSMRQPVNLPAEVQWLRVHLTVVERPPADTWSVELRDAQDNILQTLTSASFEDGEHWAGRIEGHAVEVVMNRPSVTESLKIRIDAIAVSGSTFNPQAITTRREDIVPIEFQSKAIRAWGTAVAQISFISDRVGPAPCTGFLVGKDLLLTNEHCFTNSREAKSAEIYFDFDTGKEKPTTTRTRVKELILNSAPLDYALVRLESVPSARHPLSLSTVKPSLAADRELLVIQHPYGEHKQVAIIACTLGAAEIVGRNSSAGKTDLAHFCNTDGGSSGSPVLNLNTGTVVGLHHLGFDKNSAIYANRAVQMSQILCEIRKKRPQVAQELPAAVCK